MPAGELHVREVSQAAPGFPGWSWLITVNGQTVARSNREYQTRKEMMDDLAEAGAVLAALQAAPVVPKDVLITLVREWQEARKPVGLSAPGVGVAETYQAAVKRMAAADAALAAFDLDAPEDDETETCETCQQPITGQVVRSWDDVPLCEECAETDRDETPEIHKALNASLAATAEIRERERSAGDVSDFHMGNARRAKSLREELTEIIRWRFRTADGEIADGAKTLKHAQEIADAIAPYIEEAIGER